MKKLTITGFSVFISCSMIGCATLDPSIPEGKIRLDALIQAADDALYILGEKIDKAKLEGKLEEFKEDIMTYRVLASLAINTLVATGVAPIDVVERLNSTLATFDVILETVTTIVEPDPVLTGGQVVSIGGEVVVEEEI